jgi:TonB family protein
MPENILVIEYEPRYNDRVKQALAGQPVQPSFARDADEAVRALDTQTPKLIVLSSIVPKTNTTDMIRAIRKREHLQQTPILLTVSGYTGSHPKQDAIRLGATDILPKPYSEGDFLSKVHQMLGRAAGQLTSDQIFGDVLSEGVVQGGAKKAMTTKDDVDKLVTDTLSGVMKKKDSTPAPKPKTQPGSAELDKLIADVTMTSRPKTFAGGVPRPAPAAAHEDNVAISQPVFSPAPAAPAVVEEEEPADGTRFGQYVLLEKIATGGMAEVWKARMRGVEGFQKIVAIKKILPHLSDNREFIDMFIDEAKLAAQLNHNNIIHIYDLGKIQNSYYIAMEFVDGYDLKTILKHAEERTHPVTIELSLFIASKIAAALDYAHRKRDFDNRDIGLVHRDVSPQNVLISQEGDIKLCDFGIAKAASKASHTQAGALKGKLQYMSPEQAWGKAIDKRSDIFALGTVLFEMLAGRKLFTGENEISILEQVREARVEPPSKFNDEIAPEIDRIVLKALEKEPANRYQTAAEMARDIDSVLYEMKPTPTSADLAIYMHRLNAATPVVATPPPLVEPKPVVATAPKPVTVIPPPPPPGVMMPSWESASRERKKSPVGLIAAAAVVVVIAAVAGFLLWRGGSASPKPAAVVAQTPVPVVTPPATNSVSPPTMSETAAAATAAPSTTQPPAVDTAKVAEEVQKRLAAERAKLEEQMRRQQQAAEKSATPILQRVAPQPQPVVQMQPATQTQAPAPQPVVAENRLPAPVPQPVVQPPSPPPAPVPQPAQAEAVRTREGELIPSGSEDVPAKMTRRANVPYPPMARLQRVQGTVLVSALISETGHVLDVKLVRPINRPVGLNEAALQIVRQSTFTAPMKDGVRVRAWTTVPVEFKL